MTAALFSKDIVEFLYLLSKYKISYLIVGGEAVIYYGHARLTGDIDIYYEISSNNITSLFEMLSEFWENDIPGIKSSEELMQEGIVFQFGVPPNRIDLLNKIENIEFKKAWLNRKDVSINSEFGEFDIYYIGLDDLIKNKESVNRFRDKEDLLFLKNLK
jgi:Nucleotidyltransferase of unknown function (DUF6036)